MKRLHIGSGSLLTGDEIADAVLEYAAALYESGRIETIGIPILDDGGERHDARILITPAMSMWISTVATTGDDIADPGLVILLREQSRELGRIVTERVARSAAFDPYDL
jgi:hypothetical protein